MTKELLLHLKQHNQKRNCNKCRWATFYRKWATALPLVPPDLECAALGLQNGENSWVVFRSNGEFGCAVCPNVTFHSQVTQLAQLLRHHQSNRHLQRLRAHLGIELGPRGKPVAGAPPPDAFETVWDNVYGGDQPGSSERKKVAKLQQCLFKAMVLEESRFLQLSANCVTLFRDESNGRLVIRYMAASKDLERRCGVLGLCRLSGSDAFDITAATGKMLRRFCELGEDGSEEAVRRVQSKIEAVCVDSASSETKSATLMKTPTNPDEQPLAPNLKAILRDRAHASRRMTCRPWKCDEYLALVADTIVMSRSSIVQRIQHSVQLLRRFETNVQSLDSCRFKKVTCLKAAKHRYESWAAPMGRATLQIEALIKTAEEMSIIRSWAEDAEAFLDFVSVDGGEAILQMSMLADASDEALLVTRLFDDEMSDAATTENDLEEFQQRVSALFGEAAGCFTLRGFTQWAVEFLQAGPHMIKKRGVISGSVGGQLSPEVKARCIGRMSNWLRLCKLVISAEFPDFELVQSFCAFNLAVPRRRHIAGEGQAASSTLERRLQRIATTFGWDWLTLCDQFHDHIGIARKYFTEMRCSNAEAWTMALSKPRRGHPDDVLRQALARYLAFGTSTTGVEHTFVMAKKELSHRQGGGEDLDFKLLKLARDRPVPLRGPLGKRIIGIAREIWAASFGFSRRGKRHSHRGSMAMAEPSFRAVKQELRRRQTRDTVAAFLRHRRAAVGEAATSSFVGNAGGSAQLPKPEHEPELLQGWTELHDKEAAFQQSKREKRKFEALAYGALLPDECSEEFKEAAHKDALQTDRLASAAWRARQRRDNILQPVQPSQQDFRGKKVFVCHECKSDSLYACLVDMEVTTCPTEADVIVVTSVLPKSMKKKVLWGAMLVGAYLVTPTFFTLGSCKAGVVKYNGAVRFWRRVMVSERFRELRPALTELLAAACTRPDSKWKIIVSMEEFNRVCTKARRQRKGGQVMVLRSDGEGRLIDGVVRGAKVVGPSQFELSICKVDKAHTVSRS